MQKNVIPIILLIGANTLSFSILLPVLPFLVEEEGGNTFLYGLLLAAFSAAQFVGAPLLGALSDRIGRKKVLIVSQFGTVLSWVLFGLALFLPKEQNLFNIPLPLLGLIIARLFDGVTGGNNSVAEALMVDLVPNSKKTKHFGYLGASFGIGMILGPVMGSLLSASFGYQSIVIFQIVLGLAVFISICALLPEEERQHAVNKIKWWQSLLITQRIKTICSAQNRFLFNREWWFAVSFIGYTSILILYSKEVFLLQPTPIALMLLLVGCVSIFNQLYLLPRSVKRFGEYTVIKTAQFLLAIGLVACALAPQVGIFLPIYLVTHLGIGLTLPPLKSIITSIGKDKESGELLGISEGLVSLAASFIPLTATALYAFNNQLVFYVSAGIFLLNGISFMRRSKEFHRDSEVSA